MDMTGEYRIPAPRQRVWEALNDPEVLRQAIPGCEQLDKVSDTELTARVKAKVGPVSATFNGKVTLGDLNPPESYTISGEGSGGMAGFAKGGANVHLTDEGTDTLLRYDAKADVGGKLAQIGSRLIQGTAKKMADDFFGRFSRIVAESYAGSTAAAAPATAPAGAATAETVAAMDPVPPIPTPPGTPGTIAGIEPQDRPPATPPGVPSPSFTSPQPAAEPAAAQDIVQPTLNAEASDGASPPYVPPERPAAEPPRPAPAAAARAPSQFATRETAPTPRAPAAPPPSAPVGPGFFQRPVVWVVIVLIILVLVYLLWPHAAPPPANPA